MHYYVWFLQIMSQILCLKQLNSGQILNTEFYIYTCKLKFHLPASLPAWSYSKG